MIPTTMTLAAFLASANEMCVADLYTLVLLDGSVIRYTSADVPITFGGSTWTPGLRLERGKIHLVIGVQVDQLEVVAYPTPDDVIGGNPFLHVALEGGLDGAYLQVDRAFLADWSQPPVGIIAKRFVGRIGDIDGGGSKLTLTVKSDLELLNIQQPRVLFQPSCSHSLYDAGCSLLKASFTVAGAVTGGTAVILATGLAQAAGYFTLGVIAFNSGPNAGLTRTVKLHAAGGAITVIPPLPALPTAGDAFSIYPGCDKTLDTCTTKFTNAGRFRGFPYVPNPEVALA